MGVEPLGHGVRFDVQWEICDGRAGSGKSLLGLGEEACGYVGIGVIEAALGKGGQHLLGRRPSARPDLQYPQPSSLGER